MKPLKLCLITLLLGIGLTSCQSVQVATDYDKSVNFDQYETFAYYKPGIDKAKISDLDKRRILRAIDQALTAKGLTKSENPDLLVSIFTKSAKNVDVYRHYYGWYRPWYWGYGPYWNHYNTSYTDTEGTLYIDLIDSDKRMLVWQGMGTGDIAPSGSVNEKIEHINTIVKEILSHYPPGAMKEK